MTWISSATIAVVNRWVMRTTVRPSANLRSRPIQCASAALRIVKAAQQLDQCALARAIRPDDCQHAAGRNRQIEVFQCDLLRTGIPERDVVKTDAFARTDGRNHRFFGRDHQRLQLEKLEEISKEQRILIKLPDVFQKRASQIQPLLKGLVEECQVAQGHESTKGSRHHPDQRCTGYGPRGNTRQELRHALTPGQIDTLHPEPVPQILISLAKVTAQIEEA